MNIGCWSIGYSRDADAAAFAFGVTPEAPAPERDTFTRIDLDAALSTTPAEGARADADAAAYAEAERQRLVSHQRRLARARESQARGDALVASVTAYNEAHKRHAEILAANAAFRKGRAEANEAARYSWMSPDHFDGGSTAC